MTALGAASTAEDPQDYQVYILLTLVGISHICAVVLQNRGHLLLSPLGRNQHDLTVKPFLTEFLHSAFCSSGVHLSARVTMAPAYRSAPVLLGSLLTLPMQVLSFATVPTLAGKGRHQRFLQSDVITPRIATPNKAGFGESSHIFLVVCKQASSCWGYCC